MQARCVWNGGKKCVMRVTITLSAKSARAAGLDHRVLMDRKIQLTTEEENRFAGGYQPRGGYPVRSKLLLGLSAEEKRKLRNLASVTLTTRMSYTFGSKNVAAGSKTVTLKRQEPKSDNEARARELSVENRKPTWEDEREAG